eukprot:5348731-Pleurochrysis_carterae.AAC.2
MEHMSFDEASKPASANTMGCSGARQTRRPKDQETKEWRDGPKLAEAEKRAGGEQRPRLTMAREFWVEEKVGCSADTLKQIDALIAPHHINM